MSANSGHTLYYQGQSMQCRPQETVLQAMLRHGIDIDFSCKSGVCHRCMLRCVDGTIPPQASRKLPDYQQQSGCMLACQCHPTSDMMLAPKSPEDCVTRCIGMAAQVQPSGRWRFTFEPMRALHYQTHQLAELLDEGMTHPVLGTLVSQQEHGDELVVEIAIETQRPQWLDPTTFAGLDFCLRGPLPAEPSAAIVPLPARPALWQQLGGDQVIRAVLTSFYQAVYADEALAPFFERVTIDRIIGKQFAFLKHHIQGAPVFLGEQPRNAHNWMVIHDTLFDHRQNLMRQAIRVHGIPDTLAAEWMQYEEQFRPEIVKYKPWPKIMGDLIIETEQYDTCVLDDDTVCDYCGGEILAKTTVKYHKRIGKIGCTHCSHSQQKVD